MFTSCGGNQGRFLIEMTTKLRSKGQVGVGQAKNMKDKAVQKREQCQGKGELEPGRKDHVFP